MPARHLPVRPDLTQLKHQAKDLLRAIRAGDSAALDDLKTFHPSPNSPSDAKLADAQLVLARSHGAPSWPRLVQACRLIDAIWHDDVDAVRSLVTTHPNLIHEDARIRTCNWGPPMSYAANLGRDRIIELLHGLGATDLEKALDRAILQSQIGTARKLHAMMHDPHPPQESLGSAAYTLSAPGTAFALEVGAKVLGPDGERLAPVDVLLETEGRNPAAKHAILEMYVQHGFELPDTPTMAVHRGRLDLLETHLRRDHALLSRTFSHAEIYPPGLGCHDDPLSIHGTPLDGATLLHMCVDYDELDIARWLLDRGMDVDAKAAVDANGFGGHTALFSTVVSMPNFWMNLRRRRTDEAPFTELLLNRGADPNVRASLRKQLQTGSEEDVSEYRDVTPISWGRRFVARTLVSETAIRMIAARGGRE